MEYQNDILHGRLTRYSLTGEVEEEGYYRKGSRIELEIDPNEGVPIYFGKKEDTPPPQGLTESELNRLL